MHRALSTPADGWDMSQIQLNPRGFEPLFSGKLSPVTQTDHAAIPERSNTGSEGDVSAAQPAAHSSVAQPAPQEIGGRDGPEPTRYGDWEMRGRCIDF
jgi:hypothetical protein